MSKRHGKVLKHFRNNGYSFGLEYPYIYGELPLEQVWAVWHRKTGEIVYVARNDDRYRYNFALDAVKNKCLKLNNLDPTVPMKVLDAMDTEA